MHRSFLLKMGHLRKTLESPEEIGRSYELREVVSWNLSTID